MFLFLLSRTCYDESDLSVLSNMINKSNGIIPYFDKAPSPDRKCPKDHQRIFLDPGKKCNDNFEFHWDGYSTIKLEKIQDEKFFNESEFCIALKKQNNSENYLIAEICVPNANGKSTRHK